MTKSPFLLPATALWSCFYHSLSSFCVRDDDIVVSREPTQATVDARFDAGGPQGTHGDTSSATAAIASNTKA